MKTLAGVSVATIATVLGAIYATGGCWGDWCVYRKSDGVESGARAVYMTRVIDGDTFDIGDGKNGRSGEGRTIRLAEINAPELNSEHCFAVEAKDSLDRLLRGQKLTILKDISAQDTYGRDVRFVRVEKPSRADKNVLANIWMLENGYAWYVRGENMEYAREMEQAQNDALAHRAGLWGACSATERAHMGLGNIVVSAAPPNSRCTIKGNIAESDTRKIYYLSTCVNYDNIIINTEGGERYFCSEREAEKAGWSRSGGCGGK